MMISNRLKITFGAVACAIAVACSFGPKEDPSRFYVLSAVAEQEAESRIGSAYIGIGPINVPVYLDRPQFVTRVSENKIDLREYHRWAEPLDEAITRVLTEDMTRTLGTQTIVGFPWYTPAILHGSVAVVFERFETDSAGVAHLSARWVLREGAAGDIYTSGETVLSETPAGPDTRDEVEALSVLLARLSEELASAIVSLQ
jgi:hypothetical protein